jgi:hypothetical protein
MACPFFAPTADVHVTAFPPRACAAGEPPMDGLDTSLFRLSVGCTDAGEPSTPSGAVAKVCMFYRKFFLASLDASA